MFTFAPISKLLFLTHLFIVFYSAYISKPSMQLAYSPWALFLLSLCCIHGSTLERSISSRLFFHILSLSFLFALAILHAPIHFQSYYRLTPALKASFLASHFTILFYSIRYHPSRPNKVVLWLIVLSIFLSGNDRSNFSISTLTPLVLGYLFHLFFYYVPLIRRHSTPLPLSLFKLSFTWPSNQWFAPAALPQSHHPTQPNLVDAIVQMGFTRDQAEQALRRNSFNLTRAIDDLLDN